MTHGRMLSRRTAIVGVTVIAMLALLAACEGPAGPQGGEGPQGQTLDWSDTIADANLSDSSFVIGVNLPELADPGGAFFFAIGSGFSAHYENMIWTNAHVLNTARRLLTTWQEDYPRATAVAVRSGTAVGGEGTYVVDLAASMIHPDYDIENPFETPDLALLRIDGSLSDVPSFLPREFATELRAGQPIGTLGFPGELAIPYEVVPVATFKDGVISALRPYSVEEESVTPENSRLVQHNLDLSGGTSGSPIFDHNGFIVAVNFAGTVAAVLAEVEPGVVDTVYLPTGNIGLGIRVDEVWTLIDHIDGDTASQATAATSRAYPHISYRAFPEN